MRFHVESTLKEYKDRFLKHYDELKGCTASYTEISRICLNPSAYICTNFIKPERLL